METELTSPTIDVAETFARFEEWLAGRGESLKGNQPTAAVLLIAALSVCGARASGKTWLMDRLREFNDTLEFWGDGEGKEAVG